MSEGQRGGFKGEKGENTNKMQKLLLKINKKVSKEIGKFLVSFFVIFGLFFSPLLPFAPYAYAAFNPAKEINYQGKLTLASGVAVTNANYSIVFSLYTVASGGSAVWTETRSVTTTSGLFSEMLGNNPSYPLTSTILNNTLYLGVKVGTDAEMTPRKKLGVVPAAFISEKSQNLIGGNSTTALGSIPYQSDTDTTSLRAPNTTTTKKFLNMTGTGTNGAVPVWEALADADIPDVLTGTTYNGLTFTAQTTGFTIAGGTTSKTLTVSDTATISGSNTGDQSISSLGGTTVGSNFFTLANPSAITFPRINADNTVSALDAATFRTAIGAGTGGGTVTGTGTDGYLTNWNGTGSALENSPIFTDGTKVGIGTTNPGAKLNVAGTGNTSPTVLISGNSSTYGVLEVASDNVIQVLSNANRTEGLTYQFSSSGSPHFMMFSDYYTGGTEPYLTFGTYSNKANQLVLSTNGNVGIGTTTPVATLDINGNGIANSLNIINSTSQVASKTIGIANTLTQTVGGSGHQTIGTFNSATYSGSGNETVVFGIKNYNYLNTTGTVTAAYGDQSILYNNGAVLTYGTGVEASVINNSGTLTTGYGVLGNATINAGKFNKIVGVYSNVSNASSDVTNNDAYGFYSNFHNTGVFDGYAGFQVDAYNTGTARILTGLQVDFYTAGGTTQELRGIDIGVTHPWTGTPTNSYGIYIDASTNIGTSMNYSIYSASTANSYFAGNVGIGTTGPNARLSLGVSDYIATSKPALLLYDGGTIAQGGNGYFSSLTIDQPLGSTSLLAHYQGSLQFGRYTNNNDLANITPWMTILNGGNVGIGTTNPGQLLSLKKTGTETQFSMVSDTNQADGMYFGDTDATYRGYLGYSNVDDSMAFHTAAGERVRITSNGNVGIGTTGPGRKLSVMTTDITEHAQIRFGYDDANNYWEFGRNDQSTPSGNFELSFKQNAVTGTPLVIQQSGNVGIGTTDPKTLLDVGVITTANTDGTWLRFGSETGGTYGAGIGGYNKSVDQVGLKFYTNPGWNNQHLTAMVIDTNGNVGIGTTTPAATLDINGNGIANSLNIINSTSQVASKTIGIANTLTQTAGNSGHQTIGTFNSVTYSGGNETVIFGIKNYNYLNTSGTVSYAYGDQSILYNNGAVLTNGEGLEASVINNSGTLTSGYGVLGNVDINGGQFNKLVGVYSNVDNASSNIANNDIYGFYSNFHNSGVFDGYAGLQIDAYNTGTARILTGLQVDFYTAGGTTQELRGIDIGVTHPWTGTPTNSYGIYIDASTNIGTSTNYSIYSASTANSYFAGNVGIGTTAPNKIGADKVLTINAPATKYAGLELSVGDVSTFDLLAFDTEVDISTRTAIPLIFNTNGAEAMRIASTGAITLASLTTAGVVTTTAGGVLGSVAILPSANGGSGLSNSGTLNWGSGGTLGTAAYTASTAYAAALSGTANYVSKFTGTGTTIGNSLIYDDGTNVGIGTTNPLGSLNIASALGVAKTYTGFNGNGKEGLLINSYNNPDAPYTGYTDLVALRYSSTVAGGSQFRFFTQPLSTGDPVQRMVIDSNGNVGIGTTGPATSLDVQKTDTGVGNLTTVATFGRNGAANTATYRGVGFVFSDADNKTAISGIAGIRNRSDNDYNGALAFYTNVGTASPASSLTDLTERMRITTNGNVGIGTTTPTHALDVQGATDKAGIGVYKGTKLVAYLGTASSHATNVQGYLQLNNNLDTAGIVLNSNENSYITGGNVGIGTTAPAAKLQISDVNKVASTLSSTVNFSVQASDAQAIDIGGSIGLGGHDGTGGNDLTNFGVIAGRKTNSSAVDSSGYLSFSTHKNAVGLTERMRIDKDGNVGIGTTRDLAWLYGKQLAINGEASSVLSLSASDVVTAMFYSNAGESFIGTTTDAPFYIKTNDTYKVSILSNGNVGIGTITPSEKLSVIGSGLFTGSMSSKGISSPSIASFGFNSASYLYGITNSPYWNTANGSYTNNNVVAPDGNTTASTLNLTVLSTNWDLYQTFNLTSGVSYKIGVWIKLGSATNFCMTVNNGSAWNTVGAKCFNSADGLSTTGWTYVSYIFTGPATNIANLHIGASFDTGVAQTAGTVYAWNWEVTKQNGGTSPVSTFAGYVGIGTTAPLNKLTVAGNIQTTNNNVDISDNSDWPTNIIMGNSAYPVYIKVHRYTGSYSNGLDFYYTDAVSSNSTLGIRLNSSGNVGIGTTNPTLGLLQLTKTSGNNVNLVLEQSEVSSWDIRNIATSGNFGIYNGQLGTVSMAIDRTNGAVTLSSLTTAGVVTTTAAGVLGSVAILPSAKGGSGINNTGTLTWGNGGTLGTNAYNSTAFLSSLSGALLATGATTGATSQSQTFTNGVTMGSTGHIYTSGVDIYANVIRARTGELAIQYSQTTASDVTFYGGSTTPQVSFKTDGNVGIGTTGPAGTLEISKNNASGGGQLYISNPNTANTGKKSDITFRIADSVGTIKDAAYIQAIPGGINLTEGAHLAFFTRQNDATPTESMRINNLGNVGIGTTDPGAKLNVHENSNADTELRIMGQATYDPRLYLKSEESDVEGFKMWYDNSDGDTYFDNIYSQDPQTEPAIRFRTNVNGTTNPLVNAMTIAHNGNVGIGTTGPYTKLDVVGGKVNISSGANLGFAGAYDLNIYKTTGSRIGFYDDTSSVNIGSIQTTTPGLGSDFVVNSGTTELMRVKYNGNVGIGTTNPVNAKLEVRNTVNYAIYAETSYAGGVGVMGSASTAGSVGVSGWGYDAGSAGVYGSGNRGAYDFLGAGGEYAGGGAWTNGSDRATKENFVVINNQEILNKIIDLPMTQWNYIKVPGSKHIGPIAQDFYALFGLGDGDKSISTIDPSGIALVGIQALNEKLNIESDLVTGLTGEMDTLKENISGITLIDEEQSAKIESMNLKLGALTGEIIPVAGSDEEKFANDFFANLFVKVSDWLASADNGIKTIFARKISTRLLCIADEAGVETCVEKTQLDNLLAKAGEVSAGEINDVGGVSTDTPTNTEINPGAPVITLVGEATVNLDINGVYNELSANVTDDVDTFVAVSITGVPDNSTDGIYAIHYNAVDSEGNNAIELIRKVIVGTEDYTLTGVSADSWASGDTVVGNTPEVTTDTTTVTDTTSETTVSTGFDEGAVTSGTTTTETTTGTIDTATTETVPVVVTP